ncbi:uncharacterized protein BDW43DRAFT_258821 [Aspergillus alliaceus]|uniref:uncharacterized protein n=1 Tax=Petromyces alliaceus TaxID=209559 RepID=UPI0012A63DF6|nr:uncharacterized protein BDW43DRAFT_258821 [Aspergillus alliaceus]KAB8239659.1 hypothetical protein BDW43DRAFT_258821 [Aspergillus alliaceus]
MVMPPTTRRIIMPFDLRQTPEKFFEQKSTKLLFDVFSETRRLVFNDRVLVYRSDQLPAKSWPKMIAGVQPTDDLRDEGPIIPHTL